MNRKPKAVLYLFPLFTTFFWGATFNLAAIAVQYFTPQMAAALRFIIASLVFLPVIFHNRKDLKTILKKNWHLHAAMALTGVAGYNALFFLGMKHTTPLNGALIMATNPLVSSLISAFLTGETMDKKHQLGSIISFFGVLALLLSGSGKLGHLNIGDFYIAIACIFLAFYGVIGKRCEANSSPVMTTAITTVMGAILLCILAFATEGLPSLNHIPTPVLLSLLYLGALGTAFAYVLWNYSIKHLGVTRSALFFNFVPVFTVLFSLLFHQHVNGLQLIAGAVVMLGVLIATGGLSILLRKTATKQ